MLAIRISINLLLFLTTIPADIGAKAPSVVRNIDKTIAEIETAKHLQLVEDLVIGVDEGDDNEFFGRVAGIALDSTHNIYILDPTFYRVQKFSADGTYIQTIGGKGQGPGEFSFPTAIALDSRDYLYVADHRNIKIFDASGEYVREFKHDLPGAIIRSIKIDPTSNWLYLTCLDPLEQKVVHTYGPEHEYLFSFCDSYATGRDIDLRIENAFGTGMIDIDGTGQLWYTQMTPYEIRRFSPTGDLLSIVYRDNDFMKAPEVEVTNNTMTFTMPPNSSSIVIVNDEYFINIVRLPPDPEPPTVTIIDLYNSNGRLLATRRFNRDFDLKCADDDGKVYSADYEDYFKVVRYTLSVVDQ